MIGLLDSTNLKTYSRTNRTMDCFPFLMQTFALHLIRSSCFPNNNELRHTITQCVENEKDGIVLTFVRLAMFSVQLTFIALWFTTTDISTKYTLTQTQRKALTPQAVVVAALSQ